MKRYQPRCSWAFDDLLEILLSAHDAEPSVHPAMPLWKRNFHGFASPESEIQAGTPPKDFGFLFTDEGAIGNLPGEAGITADVDMIRRELGLVQGLTSDQVSARRRQFAARNHPDKTGPAHCAIATKRMMVANALCDAYQATAACPILRK
jgi:hypothetical protein